MITWLTVNQLFWTFMLCRSRRRSDDDVSALAYEVTRILSVVATAVPAVYAFGWLLLPVWGFGAVPFGGR